MRKVAVPSWYTFKQFHFVLQYIFGPWQNCHLHNFMFQRNEAGPRSISFGPRDVLLEVNHKGDVETMFGPRREWIDERELKLSDIYAEDGRMRSKVLSNRSVVPLIYEYDFGVCPLFFLPCSGIQAFIGWLGAQNFISRFRISESCKTSRRRSHRMWTRGRLWGNLRMEWCERSVRCRKSYRRAVRATSMGQRSLGSRR